MMLAGIRETFRKEKIWLLLILITSAGTLSANFFGILFGVTIVLPHLLYVPIILASYRFPKKGVAFAACISLAYFLMLVLFAGGDAGALISGGSRALVMVMIGWIIAFLSVNIVEQKERYRALFDNAEAGAAQVVVGESGVIIGEANYRLEKTLKTEPGALNGRPIAMFWDDVETRKDFASRVRRDGVCYAYEATWKKADGSPVNVLVSAGKVDTKTSIITVIDITNQKNTEAALKNANAELNLLSLLMRNDLMQKIADAEGILDEGKRIPPAGPAAAGIFTRLENIVHSLKRRLELAASFQDLGLEPPAWYPVQRVIEDVVSRQRTGDVSVRAWTERLEIYAENHIGEVFFNLIDNAIRYGGTTTEVVVTYHLLDDGVEIIVEDDGRGIPDSEKESIFDYGAMSHGGLGLFVDRQILGVTGISLRETGTYGSGARFVLHVPRERYRIL